AYITGMSRSAWPVGYGHPAMRSISIAADQQIGVAIMWAVPALCFAPLFYGLLMTWLGEHDDPDRELRDATSGRTAPGACHARRAAGARPDSSHAACARRLGRHARA